MEGTIGEQGKFRWDTLAEGTTDADGLFRWNAPGHTPVVSRTVHRIVVRKEDDVLVLDAARSPERYHDNRWSEDRQPWLQWAFQHLEHRGELPVTLCHIFTERPVYRPEEEVHIKGYLRTRDRGRLTPVAAKGWLIVEGPGDLVWRYR